MSELRFVFLAADTSRSLAYAQAMARAGLAPAATLLYGQGLGERPGRPPRAGGPQTVNGLVLPDFGQTLEAICAAQGWRWQALPEVGVNDATVQAAVRAERPDLIVFSGYGGEIVGRALLGDGIPVLHVHAGRLPDYRGSTTVYYSLLAERACAASAILLSEAIDCGVVVGRAAYAPPPAGVDLDHGYDPALRADLLVRVLGARLQRGDWPLHEPQDPDAGETYYVIHPVLKHLALLSLPGGAGP